MPSGSFEGPELRSITLGHPLVDGYLEFVGVRGAVNTWLATAYDLKVFFEVIGGKEPAEVTSADVFAFLARQRTPRHENGGADRGRGGRACRRGRSPGGCRALRACSSI